MNKDLDVIVSRISLLFKRISYTQYWLEVVNDKYDKSYNVFFCQQKKGSHLRSTPVHKIDEYKLEYLEEVITGFRKKSNLTIKYVGFTGEVWPNSQKKIQWEKNHLE